MTWVAIIGIGWLLAALGLALILGRCISLADRPRVHASWTDDVEHFLRERARHDVISEPVREA